MRKADIARKTAETDISLSLNLDGRGKWTGDTGVGVLNHMLELLARHGRLDLEVNCKGDIDVDFHHSVEDIGIVFGQALDRALGQRRGICRFGQALIPMDEALVQTALDISGRAHLSWKVEMPTEKIGAFDSQLVEEFFLALTRAAGLTLHITCLAGRSSHHIAEGVFKSFARALNAAVRTEAGFEDEIPSTKGVI